MQVIPTESAEPTEAEYDSGFDFDIVIIGASFAGAACAIAAAQRGLRVRVLEGKRDPAKS